MKTLAFFAALATLGVAYAQDSFPSGPPVGEKLSEFKVLNFWGPDAGKEVQLLKDEKGPTLVVFVHQLTRPAFQFIKPVDKYAAELAEDKLKTHFVWLTDDKEKTEQFLNRAKNSLKLESPVSIYLEGKDGPPAYGLNDKVILTVLLSKDNKVVANFALVDPSGRDSERVKAAMAKLMGKKLP